MTLNELMFFFEQAKAAHGDKEVEVEIGASRFDLTIRNLTVDHNGHVVLDYSDITAKDIEE